MSRDPLIHAMDEQFWGSSGQPPLPEMASPSEMFWSQFWQHVQTYGVAFVITAFIGGAIFGVALHFIQNILPARKARSAEEAKKRREEELRKEENQEFAEIKAGDSVFRGKMNSKMISALRRSVVFTEETTKRGFGGAMEDIKKEREALMAEKQDESEDESSEEEDNRLEHLTIEKQDETPLLARDGDNKHDATPEDPKEGDKDMLKKLGTLHGKLATAQLRARTRRMEMEMTAAERESEAEMRAKQLESIMSLMMQNKEKFGMSSDDVKEQLNLYNF